jgi:outer membrane biosynthesis protein TonB
MARSLPSTETSVVEAVGSTREPSEAAESSPPARSVLRSRARGRASTSSQLEPGRGATALGVVFALGVHLGVIALSPREAALAAVPAVPTEVEIFVPPPPAEPEPEPPEPEPVQAVMAVRPKPVVREAPKKEEAPPPKAAEEAPPPPAAPTPEVVEKPSEPAPALVAAAGTGPSDHTIVQSATGSFGGRGTGGAGVPGGTGTGIGGSKNGVVGGTGTSAAQPVTLSLKDWRCPWPEDAEYEDFDQQTVSIRVVVDVDGRVEKADVLKDPGFGFGRAVRDCALRQRAFVPAKDSSGRSIKAISPPINVRFVR